MRRHAFALALLLLLPCSALAGKPALVNTDVTFLGFRQEWSELAPAGKEPANWEDLAEWYDGHGAATARALKQLGDTLHLDAYGRLMLIREAALRVPLQPGAVVRRFAAAIAAGGWSAHSRAFFVADQVARLGYAAIVVEAAGVPFVGLPADDPDLNADTQSLDVERSLFGWSEHVKRTFVLWSVDGRIGSSGLTHIDASPLTPPARLFAAKDARSFDFRKRSLPAPVLERSEPRTLRWPDGRTFAYRVFPDAAAYLAHYPEHSFPVQARIEAPDLVRAGLGDALRTAAGGDEDAFVSQLLRAVQANFTYQPGPLRSVTEILADGRGDCDQLSLLLALLLVEAGYPPASVAAVTWESADHLGLAVRSRSGNRPRLPEARRFTLQGADYFVLDTTYYHRRDSELITAWGEMNPDNALRQANVVVLPSLR